MDNMFEVVAEKTYVRVPAQNILVGDINVDGARCISRTPRAVQSITGTRYVDIVWSDAPLVTHVYRADYLVTIEE